MPTGPHKKWCTVDLQAAVAALRPAGALCALRGQGGERYGFEAFLTRR